MILFLCTCNNFCKMKIPVIILCLISFFVIQGWSQDFPVGARATGVGNTAVTLQDAWSTFQNISGLGSVKKTSLLFGYENQFSVSEGLQTVGAGIVVPTKIGVGSVGVSKFGDQLFSLHTLSLGYGHQIDQFNLGIRVSQQQYSMESFGTRSFVVVDIGGIATLVPELVWGLQIKNINRATISGFTGERKASFIQTGLSYRPVKALMCNVELEHEIHQPLIVKAGVEYRWEQKVAFRTGINSQSLQHYFGIGLAHRVLNFDYALSTHASLGLSHQLSIAYHLPEK